MPGKAINSGATRAARMMLHEGKETAEEGEGEREKRRERGREKRDNKKGGGELCAWATHGLITWRGINMTR